MPIAVQKPPYWGLWIQRAQDLEFDGFGSELHQCGPGGSGAHCQPHPQGKIGDRVGFFPANFVQRVRPGENVWRSCQPFSGNKEQGYMSLKENQVSAWALQWLERWTWERGGGGTGDCPGGGHCSLAAGGKAG